MVWSLIIGLIVGAIAKLLMPTRDPGGLSITLSLGVAGAAAASWFGEEMNYSLPDEPRGFVVALLGAFLVLLVYRGLLRRGHSTESLSR